MNGEMGPSKDDLIPPAPDTEASLRRIHRHTYVVVLLGTLAGLLASGGRMAVGIALGGALSVFNERWLRASTGAILGTAASSGRVPPGAEAKFILRYAVIGVVAGVALWSGYFNLLGIGIGLASFVGAVMIEAAYQGYLTFKDGEGRAE